MDHAFDDPGTLLLEVRLPPRNEHEARAALLGPDGGESYIEAQDRRFILLNNLTAAAEVSAEAALESSKCERELAVVERKLAWTAASITKPARRERLARGTIAFAVLLSAAGAIGMFVSVIVLSEYALHSASDLFANNNVVGAVLFSSLPCIGAVALKVFEQKLVSPDARWFYAVALFSTGATALVVWLVSAAIALAPHSGGSLSLITESQGGQVIGIVLLLSTVLCDVCLGYTILSGIGQLLAPTDSCELRPNPAFEALGEEKLRLKSRLADCELRRIKADDYLARCEAGRQLTRHDAQNDLNRATELFTQVQVVALGLAMAIFLKSPE